MRAPLDVGWRPSAASITPALAISSLNLPISAKSSLGGSTPASEFLSALTSSMNRIVLSPWIRVCVSRFYTFVERGERDRQSRYACLRGLVRALVEIVVAARLEDAVREPRG